MFAYDRGLFSVLLLHFPQKYRCIPKVGFPAHIFFCNFSLFSSEVSLCTNIGFSPDIYVDIFIDISIYIFIDISCDISIDIYIDMLTDKEGGRKEKEWTYSSILTTPHRRVGN